MFSEHECNRIAKKKENKVTLNTSPRRSPGFPRTMSSLTVAFCTVASLDHERFLLSTTMMYFRISHNIYTAIVRVMRIKHIQSKSVKIATATLPRDQNKSPTDWAKNKVENPVE